MDKLTTTIVLLCAFALGCGSGGDRLEGIGHQTAEVSYPVSQAYATRTQALMDSKYAKVSEAYYMSTDPTCPTPPGLLVPHFENWYSVSHYYVWGSGEGCNGTAGSDHGWHQGTGITKWEDDASYEFATTPATATSTMPGSATTCVKSVWKKIMTQTHVGLVVSWYNHGRALNPKGTCMIHSPIGGMIGTQNAFRVNCDPTMANGYYELDYTTWKSRCTSSIDDYMKNVANAEKYLASIPDGACDSVCNSCKYCLPDQCSNYGRIGNWFTGATVCYDAGGRTGSGAGVISTDSTTITSYDSGSRAGGHNSNNDAQMERQLAELWNGSDSISTLNEITVITPACEAAKCVGPNAKMNYAARDASWNGNSYTSVYQEYSDDGAHSTAGSLAISKDSCYVQHTWPDGEDKGGNYRHDARCTAACGYWDGQPICKSNSACVCGTG